MSKYLAKDFLDKCLSSNKIAHTFLFIYKDFEILNEHLIYFISKINNKNYSSLKQNDADILFLEGKSGEINKENVKFAIDKLADSPLNKENTKILILNDIEQGHDAALNTLLKTIEEPNGKTIVILTSSNSKKVLKTLISRSQIINLTFDNLEKKQEFLQLQGISELESKILAQVFKNKEIALEHFNQDFSVFLKDLLDILEKALNNFFTLKFYLTKILNKSNSFLYISTLKLFYLSSLKNDISIFNTNKWKKIIEKYYFEKNNKIFFLVQEMEKFLLKTNTNENFNLQKELFLIKISDLYEKSKENK